MDHIDSELTLLREKMARLEEQKRLETEKANHPMKTLEETITSYKRVSPGYNNRHQNERFNDAKTKLAYLEPIFMALQNIMARLDALEQKS
jgi:hypothetical protein